MGSGGRTAAAAAAAAAVHRCCHGGGSFKFRGLFLVVAAPSPQLLLPFQRCLCWCAVRRTIGLSSTTTILVNFVVVETSEFDLLIEY